jgi:predicted PurR-regulated permease PerM
VPRSGTLPHPEAELSDQREAPESVAPPDEAVATVAAPDATPSAQPLSRRTRLALGLGLAAAALLFLYVVRDQMQPFIWAGVLAYVLTPVVNIVRRRLGLGRGTSVALVMAAFLGLVGWGISVAVPVLQSDITALTQSLSGINSYLVTFLPNAGTPLILGIPIPISNIIHSVQSAISDLPNMMVHDVYSVASNAISSLLHVFSFAIATFYLLLDAPRLGHWLASRIPPRHRAETVMVVDRVNGVLSDYLRAEAILILIMGVASFLALSILGVRFAVVLAPVVGFLEIFPIVGPFLAITLVTIVALVGPPGFGLSHVGFAVVVALVFFAMRQLEDYLVIPRVLGHAVKLHPVIILFSLLCGASIGGILGMFLAVPVTGALKVLGGYLYDRLVE